MKRILLCLSLLTCTSTPQTVCNAAYIKIPISVGELIDKISILEIKLQKIADPAKRANIATELDSLMATYLLIIPSEEQLSSDFAQHVTVLKNELFKRNWALWDLEDAIREKDRLKDFGDEFVTIARRIYQTNDERAYFKRKLNTLFGSKIIEEKSYTKLIADSTE